MTGADFTDAALNVADFTGAIDASATSAVASWESSDEEGASTLASAHDGTGNHGALLHGADFSGVNLSGSIFNHKNDSLDAVGWAEADWTAASFHYLDPRISQTGWCITSMAL